MLSIISFLLFSNFCIDCISFVTNSVTCLLIAPDFSPSWLENPNIILNVPISKIIIIILKPIFETLIDKGIVKTLFDKR